MNIPKPLKVVLLVLTLWVPLYMIWFMTLGMGIGLSTIDFDLMFKLHTGTMFVSALLMVVYIVHLFKLPAMDSGTKALWGITLFCGAPIAMPIYFFKHIGPEPAPLAV